MDQKSTFVFIAGNWTSFRTIRFFRGVRTANDELDIIGDSANKTAAPDSAGEPRVLRDSVAQNRGCAWHDQQIGGGNPILEALMEGIQHRCGKGRRKTEGPVEAVGALASRTQVKHRKALAVGKLVRSNEAQYPSVPPAYW